ncbi:MAG: CDP-alcohol phosphatidyltransferase family protein [Gemmatimonadaceae bacterium]|nr:CDP-alcohol phosphatidyltransferase family protein [Gemmatimonadaceae bacterium]
MRRLWWAIRDGYLRLLEPLIGWCVRHRVPPNAITTVGTCAAGLAGALFAAGWIRSAGWTLGLLAFFDVLDGAVARRTGRATDFGAFYDATLDRVADAALLGGVLLFYAWHEVPRAAPMTAVALVALVATSVTSYTRSRGELIGVGMRGIGWMERPERITLLAAPQAFFGRAFDGWILDGVVGLLALTSVATVVQRVRHVARAVGDRDTAVPDGG